MSLEFDRWRLVLGRYAEGRLDGLARSSDRRMDRVLDFLYGRGPAERGARPVSPGMKEPGSSGGTEESRLTVPDWVRDVRELFPRESCEVITTHALERYGMTELMTDPETLERLTPSYDLLKAVLTFRDAMTPEVVEVARRIVRKVVEELTRKIAQEVRPALRGQTSRHRRSRHQVFANFDALRTIRRNLANYDPERRKLLAKELSFFAKTRPHVTWDIVMAVDCSASMLDSVIHSAVMAGIFHAIPSLRVRLVAFDTSIVDLSDEVADPTELLLSVQLGGGTDIGGALEYCASLVEQPSLTILIVVTDFEEGGGPERMLTTIRSLSGDGVKVLGLAALNESAEPSYDREIAQRCVSAGAHVAALTPNRLAEWVCQTIR